MVAGMSVQHCLRSVTLVGSFYALAVAMVISAPGAPAFAQPPPPAVGLQQEPGRENQFALWAGYGDSDNIGRAVIPEEGTYSSLGVFLAWMRLTSRLDAAIDSDIEYRTYGDDSLENETVGTLDAHAFVDLVEDRFAWDFQGNLDEGQQDPFVARGPGNRETIKYLATGPRVDIPFGRTSLAVSATRAAQRYEESPQADNDSNNYQLVLSRQARPTTEFALGATSSEYEYVDGVAPTYRIDQLFLRVAKTLPRGTLDADVGTNEIKSDTESRRDPLLNLTWSRLLGARSNFVMTAAQGFTRSGVGTGGTALVTTTPFERQSLGVNYTFTGERTTVLIGLEAGQDDHAGGGTIDNDYLSNNLVIDYRISARLDIGLRHQRYDREYGDPTAPSASQEDRTTGVWLNRTFGRRFSIALDASRYEALTDPRIEETRWELRLVYSPTGDTASAMGSIGR
jgi:hypothetical protein